MNIVIEIVCNLIPRLARYTSRLPSASTTVTDSANRPSKIVSIFVLGFSMQFVMISCGTRFPMKMARRTAIIE